MLLLLLAVLVGGGNVCSNATRQDDSLRCRDQTSRCRSVRVPERREGRERLDRAGCVRADAVGVSNPALGGAERRIEMGERWAE